jgi:hypothetical protein
LQELKFLEIGQNFQINSTLRKILKFFLISGVFDKPARASILNIISSNGYYGCLKCLQPGVTENHVHLYKYDDSNPSGPMRNKEFYDIECEEQLNGIKGKSGLSELHFYSPLYSTNIDYMHSVLEGVMKRFFRYWFDEKGDHSVKTFTREIDKRLLNINPPSFIPITPRSIEQRAKWRANEYLNFLLFYCLPVFNGIMKPVYYLHLMKLVVSMECLLDKVVKREKLGKVRMILISFVKESQELYPKEIMVSGMHELLHLVDCTLLFGPLNCVNSFQFEELNRKIINLIHGDDLMGDEFFKLFNILQALTYYSFRNTNSTLRNFFEEYNIIKTSNRKRLSEINTFQFKALDTISISSIEVNQEIAKKFPNQTFPLQMCTKLSFNGIRYTSSLSSKTRHCDYCIKTSDGEFGLIENFVFNEVVVYIVLRKITKIIDCFFDPLHSQLKSQIFLCKLTQRRVVTTIDKIAKAFLINVAEHKMFISTFSISHLFM